MTGTAATDWRAGWETLYNLRDLSTAVTGAGRLQPGRLFRCANPALASAKDAKRFVVELGVRTLCDLRNQEEADATGDTGGLLAQFATAPFATDAMAASSGRRRIFIGGGMSAVSKFTEIKEVMDKMTRDMEARGSVYANQNIDMGVFMRALLVRMPQVHPCQPPHAGCGLAFDC